MAINQLMMAKKKLKELGATKGFADQE